MRPAPLSAAELAERAGHEIGVSPWLEVGQAMIDDFAATTLDHQYIHVDHLRAGRGPFGGTIAHGFLILSLLSHMAEAALPGIAGARIALNYGLNRVRFVSPVRAASRLRARFVLVRVEPRESGGLLQTLDVTIEIEGETRPALVAQWLTLTLLGPADRADVQANGATRS